MAVLGGHVSARKLLPPGFREAVQRRLGEIGAMALSLIGLAMLLALAAYHPGDPSANTASAAATRNIAGPIGAVFADAMLQSFGLAAVLLPACLLSWAWKLVGHRGIAPVALRLAALLGAIPSVAASLAPLPAPALTHLGGGFGGAGGQVLWQSVAGGIAGLGVAEPLAASIAFGPLSATPSAPEGVVGGLDQVVRQAIAIAATLAYSAVGTVVILLGVGLACGGLRVSGEAERAGLDEVLPGKRLA